MKLFILSYIAIFLHFTNPPMIDPNGEFDMYITKFEGLTNVEVTVPIKFTEFSPERVLGTCYYRIGGNIITINKSLWYTLPSIQREFLIYHELLHCQCSQYLHHDDVLDDGCPESVMNSLIISWSCLMNHRERYIEDMIRRCK